MKNNRKEALKLKIKENLFKEKNKKFETLKKSIQKLFKEILNFFEKTF